MSLINDVLKDLEQRRPAGPPSPLARQDQAPVHRRRRHQAWFWLLCAAVATGLMAHVLINDRHQTMDAMPLLAEWTPLRVPAGPIAADPPTVVEEPVQAPELVDMVVNHAPSPDVATEVPEAPLATTEAHEPDQLAQPDQAPRSPASESPHRHQPQVLVASTATTAEPAASIEIRRSNRPDQQPDNPLDTAKRAVARGQFARAESMLDGIISQDQADSEAFVLLASLHLEQGRGEAAMAVLSEALARAEDPAPAAAILGRLLLERNQTERALTVLGAHRPPVAVDPDYHLLLAATYRQAGEHQAAADSYRALTRVVPDQGAVWIGLAASLESLGQYTAAGDAYRHALTGNDPRLTRFARQRLGVLEQIHGDPP